MSARIQDMKSGQNSRRVSRHYFTTGRKTNPKKLEEMSETKGNEFRVPGDINNPEFVERFLDEQKEERRRNRRVGYARSHNYRSRLRQNLTERLHVPDVEALPGKSITDDVDRDFYTLATGRKIKVNKKIREYLKDLRSCFFTKLKIGYCSDEILRKDEEDERERRRYEEIKGKFEMYLNCFEEFLKSDHSSSLQLLRAADEERKKSQEMEMKINVLTDDLRRLEAELLILEEKWSTYRMYQRFLYNISPSEWRKENDSEFHPEGATSPDENIQSETSQDELSVKIAKFVRETTISRPPRLYFENPEQVQRIFHELETNNVIALTYCEELEKPIQKMLSDLEKVKTGMERSQREVEEDIEFMRALVEEEEAKAAELQEKTKEVVFGMCKDFIVNEENLTVTALVEDAYEDAIAPNHYDLSMVTMMKEIELKYETLLLTLDKYHYSVLGPAIRGFYRDQKRMEEEAKEAERKVHQMEILLKRLSKSLTYPKKGPHHAVPRKLVHRSEPRKESLRKYDIIKVPTKEEKELEYFFGKTCRNVGEAGLYRPLCSMSKSIFPALPE